MLIICVLLWITTFLMGRILYLDEQKLKDAKTVDIRVLDRSEPIPLSEVKFWFKQPDFGRDYFENSMIRLDRILDCGIVPEMYINYALGYLMPKKNLDENELERAYLSDIHVKAYPCVKCGGITHLAAGQEKTCGYCQAKLPDYYGKSVIEGTKFLESMKGVHVSNVKKRKTFYLLIGGLYLLLGLFLTLSCFVNLYNDERSEQANFIIVLFFCATLSMMILSWKFLCAWRKQRRALKDYYILDELVKKEDEPVSIKQIKTVLGVSEKEAYKRVDQVLDCRLFPDMYLNETIGYLLYTDHIKNSKLRYDYLEEYGSERFVCKKCGGESILKRHQNRICPYCGNPM